MAARAITIANTLVTQLQKIGVDPGTGWESGAGAPTVTRGRPKRDALADTPERQVWVQHVGTLPIREGTASPGHQYRITYQLHLFCPDSSTTGEDRLYQLERDCRRAIQLNEAALFAVSNAGVWDDEFRVNDEMQEAGIHSGSLVVVAEYLSEHNDP